MTLKSTSQQRKRHLKRVGWQTRMGEQNDDRFSIHRDTTTPQRLWD